MKSLEQKSCSGCGQKFICGAESGEESCWCNDLPHVSLVANEDQDCFCPQCLREAIQKLNCPNTSAGSTIKAGVSSQYSLVEGEDYYSEGGAIVFTARYHFRRGYCCDSGCRHCPYPGQPSH
jgi:uncharacterized protein DUF5522/cysteine-rich CWC protein